MLPDDWRPIPGLRVFVSLPPEEPGRESVAMQRIQHRVGEVYAYQDSTLGILIHFKELGPNGENWYIKRQCLIEVKE